MHLNGRLDNSSSVSAWIAKTAKQLLCQTIYGNGLAPESIFIHFIKGKYLILQTIFMYKSQTKSHGFWNMIKAYNIDAATILLLVPQETFTEFHL